MARSVFSRERIGPLRVLPGGRGAGDRGATLTDEQLIEAFECGDRQVSALLYDRLFHVVDRTLYRVLGTRIDEHDDLVQSAFEQIMLTLARKRFARACSLSSWAATVTTHVALNALRSRMRERKVIERSVEGAQDVALAPDDVERQASARRELARLRVALSRMDEKKATTVLLHDVLGHELAEIAVLTGVTVAAAQSRLVRGRRELHERLQHDLAVSAREERP